MSNQNLEKEDDYPYCPNWKNAHYGLARLGPHYYPLEAFEIFESIKRDKSWKYPLAVLSGVLSGIFLPMFIQKSLNRPKFSQIYFHISSVILFGTLIPAVVYVRDVNLANKNAVIKHYIQLHPEDFPPIKRIKIKDTIHDWRCHR